MLRRRSQSLIGPLGHRSAVDGSNRRSNNALNLPDASRPGSLTARGGASPSGGRRPQVSAVFYRHR